MIMNIMYVTISSNNYVANYQYHLNDFIKNKDKSLFIFIKNQ